MSQCAKYVDCPVTPVLTPYVADPQNNPLGVNIVTNGGFTTQDFTGWTAFCNSGTPTVFPSGSENAQFGPFFADFGTINNLSYAAGGLSQTVATVVGASYMFSFWMTSNPVGTPGAVQFQVLLNGTVAASVSNNNTPLQLFTFTFQASSVSTTIDFQFGSQNEENWAVGNISVAVQYVAPQTFVGLGFGPNTPPPLGWEFDLATGFSVQTSSVSQAAADAAAYAAAVFEAQQNWVPPGGVQPIEWGDYPSDIGEPGSVTELPLT